MPAVSVSAILLATFAAVSAPSTDYPTPTKAVCDARRATVIAVAVDEDATAPIVEAVLARLTQGCCALVMLDPGGDDVAKAKDKNARVLVRINATFAKTGTARIDRTLAGTYRTRVSSRVVRVADTAVLADIYEKATLMGVNDDAAASFAGKRSPLGERSKDPLAWRAGDQILRAIDIELGIAR